MPCKVFIGLPGALNSRKSRQIFTGLTAAVICAFTWWWFRPSLLNYESYLYAGGIEGFIDVSKLYNVFVPEIRMPDFSRYHPNHPLPHLLTFALWRAFRFMGFPIPAVEILTVINFVASAIAVFLVFRIALIVTANHSTAFFFALLAGFSPVFWFSAVSAESYEVAYCLMVLAFLSMLRPYNQEAFRSTIRKAMVFSLAFCFHFGIALFALPIIAWYLVPAVRQKSFRPVLSLMLYGAFCICCFVLIYVVIFMQFFGIRTLPEWWQIFSMQTRIPMGGQYAPEQSGIIAAAEILLTFLAQGLLAGHGIFERIARIHLLLAIAVGVMFVLRMARRRAFAAAHAAWIIIPLFFLLFVMRSPTNITYSLMLMLPAFLACLMLIQRAASRKVASGIVMVWMLVTAVSSLNAIMLPKTGLSEESVFFAARIPHNALRHETAVALVHNYYGIFPDIYYLGNRRGIRMDAIFFHYDQKFPAELLAQIHAAGTLQLVTDKLLAHEEAWLRSKGVSIEQVFFHSEHHPAERYWFSVRPRISVADGYRRELSLYRLSVH